jgi:hypothetical protein
LDTLEPIPSTTLLSAQEAKDRLGEIVEGFFLRRLRAEDGMRVGRLLIKSPPGLGKTTQAIECAIRYQAEQEGKDCCRLFLGDFNEAGVPAQTSIFVARQFYRPIGYGLPHPPVGPRQSGKGSSKIALPGTQI